MSNQGVKTLAIFDTLEKLADKNNPISLCEIVCELNNRSIRAERKSIYRNLKALKDYGTEIAYMPNRGYYIKNRRFSLGEIQILIDMVKGARFLDFAAVTCLVEKLKKCVSIHQAKRIKFDDCAKNRTKNTKIFSNVESISNAIFHKRKTRILYETITLNGNQNMVEYQEWRIVNPGEFFYKDGEYFLNIYDRDYAKYEKIKASRILKAQTLSEDYSNNYTPQESFESVEIRCDNDLLQEVLEVFGKDVKLRPSGREHFVAIVNFSANAEVVQQILKFGDTVEVISPIELRRKMREKIRKMSKIYKINI